MENSWSCMIWSSTRACRGNPRSPWFFDVDPALPHRLSALAVLLHRFGAYGGAGFILRAAPTSQAVVDAVEARPCTDRCAARPSSTVLIRKSLVDGEQA